MSISLKDVEYIYDAGTERAVPALSQINLTVHPGEILGILLDPRGVREIHPHPTLQRLVKTHFRVP